ncbi:ATPase [Methanopyrus sp. SNP6]|uniref:ATPase n=1 Tax=Methanopyrus sp. SNP6 TaxID=1937005 RepID=UPI0011E5BA10|nr:ATPase [Methanopyrus sp. SNP6]
MKKEVMTVVDKLRKEIGTKGKGEPDIVDVREEDGTLVIVGRDRSDMSYFIGPGGYVAGRLKEELGVDRVVVQAWTDLKMRLLRLDASHEVLERYSRHQPDLKGVLRGIEIEKARLYGELPWDYWERWEGEEPRDMRITVAASGGYDSTASAIILRKLGYEVESVTVDPGPMFLPPKLRRNVEILSEYLGTEPKFVEEDLSDVVEGALEKGRFHPCGRCNAKIRKRVMEESDTDVVAFGDGLPTGHHCVQPEDDRFKLHVPAALAKTKFELRRLVEEVLPKFHDYKYACPFLHQVHQRHPHLRRASIQRVLRELRHGFLEVGEALKAVYDILGG